MRFVKLGILGRIAQRAFQSSLLGFICVLTFNGVATADSSSRIAPVLNQQLQVATPDRWEFELTPYVWLAGLSGDVTVRNREADVDLDFGDLLDVLDMAVTGHFEARKGPLSIMLNVDYYEFGADADLPLNIDVEAGLDELILEGGIGYLLHERSIGAKSKPFTFEGLLGARYVDIESEIDFEGPVGLNPTLKGDKSWLDGYIGFRMRMGWTERMRSSLRFDVGGGGSDLTYQVALIQRHLINDRFDFVWGYRHLAIDYEDGSGADKFALDVAMTGPLVGLNIKF